MIRRHLIKNEHKRKKAIHIVSAFTILMHAYENYETGHHPYQFFLIAGITVLVLALFHNKIENKIPWIDGAFFVIEGFLSFIIAWNSFQHGKKAIPIVYALLACFQFYMAFRKGRKGIAHHKAKHMNIATNPDQTSVNE